MAKIMTKSMNPSGVNNNNHHGVGCNNNMDDWSSPVMIKMQSFSRFGSNLKTLRSSTDSGFFGRRVDLRLDGRWVCTQVAASGAFDVKMSISIGKSSRWWEKGVQPNMKEITGAEDLVESLNNAGDQLVVVDFFSPGCGGCKALHPKLCQLAEMNPDVQFLQVNYEEHKSMCYSLHVHVLPFFRFYRGAEGRLCSFSCTNATIKKFKDALAKHKPERCSLGPAKGLEEKDLVALGANQDLSFVYNPKPESPQPSSPVPALSSSSESSLPLPVPLKQTLEINEDNKDKTLVSSGR